MNRRSLLLPVLAFALLFLAVACNDGSEEEPTVPVVPTTSVPAEVTPEPTAPPSGSPGAQPSPGGSPAPSEEGDAAAGEALFTSASPAPCSTCHSTGSDRIVGPGLAGVAERAGTREPGVSADEYLHQSIREPNAYTVEGFPAGAMPAFTDLTDQQVNDLVAYLKTLQ